MIVRKASLEPIEFDGLKIFDYTGDAKLSASLACIDVPSGSSHPRALSRRSDKYYLITDGAIEFEIGGETTTLFRGDFCFIPRGETFSYCNGSSEPASLVLAHAPSFELPEEEFLDGAE